MPLVEITMYEGRPDVLKERLIASVSDTVAETLAIDLDEVIVVLKEVEHRHWAVGGLSAQKRKEQE